MKTIKLHKIKVLKVKAETMAAYKISDSVYENGELSFNINYVSEKSFRLVYNGIKLIAIIEGTEQSITTTIFKIEEFTTEEKALDRVSKLGLKIEDELEEYLANKLIYLQGGIRMATQ